MKTSIRNRLLLLLFIMGTIWLFYYFEFDEFLTFQMFQQHKQTIVSFIEQRYIFSLFLFILLYIFIVALSLPGGTILTIASGFLFDTLPGAMVSIIGASIGACLAFLSARYLIGEPLQQKYKKQLKHFNKKIEQFGTYFLLMVRLIPIFPFFIINILAGLTQISLQTFFVTTALGIIPATVVYAYAGTQLATITSAQDILSPPVLLAFGLLILLTLIPIIIALIKKK